MWCEIMVMKMIYNKIGDEGAKMISEALIRNSTLTILDVDSDEKKKNQKE